VVERYAFAFNHSLLFLHFYRLSEKEIALCNVSNFPSGFRVDGPAAYTFLCIFPSKIVRLIDDNIRLQTS